MFFTIYCVIVIAGRFSHDSYTIKRQDILSQCLSDYVSVKTFKGSTNSILNRKMIVCYKNVQ